MYRKILGVAASFVLSSLLVMTSQIVNAASMSKRLAGNDRYETGAKIVQEGWTSSNYAVIASGEGFADALCAAPLAKEYNAPILLTERDTLDSNTKNELKRLNVKSVFIVGGIGSVSDNVKSQLEDMGITVTRISGKDRLDTSLQVAKSFKNISSIVVDKWLWVCRCFVNGSSSITERDAYNFNR